NTSNEQVVADAVHMLEDLAEQVRDAEPIGHREPVVVPGRPEDWAEGGDDASAADEDLDPNATAELPFLRTEQSPDSRAEETEPHGGESEPHGGESEPEGEESEPDGGEPSRA